MSCIYLMGEQIVKYALVYFWSMLKFIFGPAFGLAANLHPLETGILTVLGMMTSVFVISIIGENIRKWIVKKIYKGSKPGQSKNRRINKILKAHGLKGVAFLTPLLLTPILGTILALSLGELRKKIFVYMLISAVCWSIVLTFLAYKFKELFIYLKDLIDFPV